MSLQVPSSPKASHPPSLTAQNLTNVAHGFFTRKGGVSEGIFASLNCGYGSQDEKEAVSENRRRVEAALGGSLCSLAQIHSAEVITVTAPWEKMPEADAMVTKIPGLILGILTADCVPILFSDNHAKVIGAAHAGWKGAIGGVIEATLDAMEREGAQRANIAAAIGPAIGWDSYEVGPEFIARFQEENAENACFFKPSPQSGQAFFAIQEYVCQRLTQVGVKQVEHSHAIPVLRKKIFSAIEDRRCGKRRATAGKFPR